MTATIESPVGAGIRPFHVDVPEADLVELRRRIEATRWPDKETDPGQGVQLELMQALAKYWAEDYDWRRCEAGLRVDHLPADRPVC